MSTYEPSAVLEAISDNAVWVILLAGPAVVFNYLFFAYAARAGFRALAFPFALWTVAIWAPHDGNYLLNFDKWFNQYDHWFPILWWVALIGTFTFECVYIYLVARNGRSRIAPQSSERGWRLSVVGGVATAVAAWIVFKGAVADDLYLISFVLTVLMCGPGSSFVLSRRHSDPELAQLVERTWLSYIGMVLTYCSVSVAFFGGGFFHSWEYLTLCAACIAWGPYKLWQVRTVTAERPLGRPVPAAPAAERAPVGVS